MSQVCEDVRVLPGGLTSELRHLWGLNNILQPVMNLDIKVMDMAKDRSYPHYVVIDENNNLISSLPIYNEKPKLENNQTTITGKVDKGVFKTLDSYVDLILDVPELTNGNYWLKLNISKPIKMVRIFKERPKSTEKEIVLRGNIERQKFKNNSIGLVSAHNLDNGSYWAKLPVTDKRFIIPEKEKQPKKTGKQILLFGEVKDNYFKSYIYECETNTVDGKYWLLMDIDTENPIYERAINEKPSSSSNQIRIEGTVNDSGVFVSEVDAEHQFRTEEREGKYWVVFDIVNEPKEFKVIENLKPTLEENQSLIEGTIWVDKYTGEIKFDPKKNRDDHRHHAIDALVIALSKQSYFQQLSAYNAQREAKYKGLQFDKEQLNFPEPWLNFHSSAKKEAEKILVSHRQNRNVLTQVRKRIVKNGKSFTSVGDAVRGELHKEFVYGKRKAPHETKTGYHKRKKVSELKDNQLKKIVDLEIRKIIINARKAEAKFNKEIALLEKQKKDKRTSDEEVEVLTNQIIFLENEIRQLYTLKNKNGQRVPIKKVRVREEMSNAQKLKETNQHVNPRNNHHALVYKKDNGTLKESITTFWEVVERQKQGQNIYQLPNEAKSCQIVTTLQENDMYLLGLTSEEFADNKDNYDFLIRYLYRVQKISKKKKSFEFYFRNHLASTLNNDNEGVSIQSFKKWAELNPMKVTLNDLGVLI